MVDEQLVPRGIHDLKTLEAMRTVPRHLFVEDAMKDQAYGDFPLPIGRGQTISQPYIVALMTQALGLQGRMLDLGCGPADIPLMLIRRHPQLAIDAVDGAPAMLDLGFGRRNGGGGSRSRGW